MAEHVCPIQVRVYILPSTKLAYFWAASTIRCLISNIVLILMVMKQHDDLTLKFSSGANKKKDQQINHYPTDSTFVKRLKKNKLKIKLLSY